MLVPLDDDTCCGGDDVMGILVPVETADSIFMKDGRRAQYIVGRKCRTNRIK